jgi:hypothetical protein
MSTPVALKRRSEHGIANKDGGDQAVLEQNTVSTHAALEQ